MQNDNTSLPDSVDAVLGVDARDDENMEALRGAIFAKTVGVIRRRRRVKRGLFALSLCGCYLAGAMTVGVWRVENHRTVATTPNTSDAVARIQPQPESQSQPETQPTVPPQSSVPPENVAATPAVSEFQVPAKMPTAFESWRNVGDYYLKKYGDIALATASYAQAIDLATEEERAISPGRDNWLLMALKDARAKEKQYASYQPN
jgi:hypothetical protein